MIQALERLALRHYSIVLIRLVFRTLKIRVHIEIKQKIWVKKATLPTSTLVGFGFDD